jgi:hypothetical protein
MTTIFNLNLMDFASTAPVNDCPRKLYQTGRALTINTGRVFLVGILEHRLIFLLEYCRLDRKYRPVVPCGIHVNTFTTNIDQISAMV